MFKPTGFLDIIIAFATVMLALSLVVKVIQEFFKRMGNRKGEYFLNEAKRYLGSGASRVLDELGKENKSALSGLNADQLVSLARTRLGNKMMTDIQKLEKELEGTFDAILASFKDYYQKRMRTWAILISFAVVFFLNVDAIVLWENLSKNQAARLALASQAAVLTGKTQAPQASGSQKASLPEEFEKMQEEIRVLIEPLREGHVPFGWTSPLEKSFKNSKISTATVVYKLFGLLMAGALVAAGAPFWHDVLESVLSMKKFARRKENQTSGATT